ncbi:HlyD family secretion protein [Pedobacter insulae]|uniref:HlyD family secretion protein n=2 Tax=Pedobacter insulae TaxID=414048 RepID=A0A1I2X7U0_9SPHI|nr:HlyD family secretion protein [Pedobacter insulae]
MQEFKQEATVNTRLVYLKQIGIKSQVIYTIFLLFLITSLGLLPFLTTTISVRSQGIIQSACAKAELIAPINGRLVEVNLSDNQKVKKGETLLMIDNTLGKQQSELLAEHELQLRDQLLDVEQLTAAIDARSKIQLNRLKTAVYSASWHLFAEERAYAVNIRQHADLSFQRHQKLFLKNVISLAELEKYKFNYEQALVEQQRVDRKYKSQWLLEGIRYRDELRIIDAQKDQLNEQGKKYIVKANITGSVQNLIGLQIGAHVYANQKIGEISPDGSLLAICYVSPSYIGFIKKGQSVRFQIDAFNYTQWGMLTGKVVDISDDVIVLNNNAYFKVKCQLNSEYLALKSRYKGKIRKGMTLKANFIITERSFYQLLFDHVSDWLQCYAN